MRALLYKEWRETRVLFLAAVVGVILLGSPLTAGWRPFTIVMLALVLAFATNLIAADAFATESSKGTLPFTLSLPLDRGIVWAATLTVRVVEFVLLAMIVSIVLWVPLLDGISQWMTGPNPPGTTVIPPPLSDCIVLVFPTMLCLFCCAFTCSVLIDATVTAAMGGYCLFAGVVYFLLEFTPSITLPELGADGLPGFRVWAGVHPMSLHLSLQDMAERGHLNDSWVMLARMNRICSVNPQHLFAVSAILVLFSLLVFIRKEVR